MEEDTQNQITPQEFAQKVKAKYPQYANVDDITLARKMVEKYPEYASQVNFDSNVKKKDTSVSSTQTPPQGTTELPSEDGSLATQSNPFESENLVGQIPTAPKNKSTLPPEDDEVGALDDLWNTFKGAGVKALSIAASIPRFAQNAAMDLALSASGDSEEFNKLPSAVKKQVRNYIATPGSSTVPFQETSDYLNKKSEQIYKKTRQEEVDVVDELSKFKDNPNAESIQKILYQGLKTTVESVPNMVIGAVSLPVMGVVAAAGKRAEDIEETGDVGIGNLLNAGVYGTAEAVFEGVTNKILGKAAKSAIGKPVAAKAVAEGFVKSVLKDFGQEGASEGATTLIQEVSDKITKGEDVDFYKLSKEVANSAILGGLSGGGISAVGGGIGKIRNATKYVAGKVTSKEDINKVNNNIKTIQSLNLEKGDDVDSKINEIVDKKITQLTEENSNIIKKNENIALNLSENQVKQVFEIDNQLENNYNSAKSIIDNESMDDKAKKLLLDDLLKEQNDLKQEKEKIKANAIQEQTTNESVLRTEQPEVELQGVGEGNAKPEELTTEKEIADAKQKIDEARIKRRVENKNLTEAKGSTWFDSADMRNAKIGDEVYFSDNKSDNDYKTKVKDIVDGKIIFENGKTFDDVSSGINVTAEDAWFDKNHPELTLKPGEVNEEVTPTEATPTETPTPVVEVAPVKEQWEIDYERVKGKVDEFNVENRPSALDKVSLKDRKTGKEKLEDELYEAKKNLSRADNADLAIEEYNKKKKELEYFDKETQKINDFKRVNDLISSEIEQKEKDGDNYEFNKEFNKDPREAASKSAKELIDFLEERGDENDLEQIDRYKNDIKILEQDIKENPLKRNTVVAPTETPISKEYDSDNKNHNTNMSVLSKALDKSGIIPPAEPFILESDNSVSVTYKGQDYDSPETIITFNKNKNGAWSAKGYKVEITEAETKAEPTPVAETPVAKPKVAPIVKPKPNTDTVEQRVSKIDTAIQALFDRNGKDTTTWVNPSDNFDLIALKRAKKALQAGVKDFKIFSVTRSGERFLEMETKFEAPKVEPTPAAKPKTNKKLDEDIAFYQKDVDYYEFRIPDLEEEIKNEAINTKQEVAELNKKIAEVKADKSLSREQKKEAVEDLKYEIENTKENQQDTINDLKDDLKEAKAEQKKSQKKLDALKEKRNASTEVKSEIDELLDLDATDEKALKKASDFLGSVIDDIDRIGTYTGANTILLKPIKVIIQAIKALVDAGLTLQQAIERVAKDEKVTQRDIINGINSVAQIVPIEKEFNELMDKAQALITRQKSKGITEKKIISNLDTMVRKSDIYTDENTNNAQRKIMEREARAKMGVAPKRAVSIGRVIGALNDIKNVSREEKLKIIGRIRELSRDAVKDLVVEIRELAKGGKITTNQAVNIISRFGKVNMLNEISVSNFVDYMAKVFADANYAKNISEIKKLQRQAKSRNHTSMTNVVREFTSINPELIPLDRIQVYVEALDFLNNRTPSYSKMNDILSEISSYEIVDDFDAVKTMEALEKKYEKIELNKLKSVEEYVSLIRDINSFKRKAYQLLQEDVITQEEYDDLINRVGNDQAAVEKKYEKEISQIKKDLINEIKKQRPKRNEDFSNEENNLIKKYLTLSDSDLKSLSPEDLFILNDILENISNGEIDYYRFNDVISRAFTNDGINQLAKQIEDSKFNMSSEKGRQELSEQESAFWEGLLGMGRVKAGALQKFVISTFNRAIGSYESFIKDGYNEFLKLKKKYNIKDNEMHKIGILTTYLQEYMAQFDSKNEGINNIGKRDWFKEILNNPAMKDNYSSGKPSVLKMIGIGSSEIEVIKEIWNKLTKDENGNVNPKDVYESYINNDGKFFTKNEKAFFDDVMKYKASTITPKQKAANELSGKSFKEIPFHMLRVRLDNGKNQIQPSVSNNNGTVRINANTGKERISEKVGPVMTNFEKLFISNIEQTGRDYFLSGSLKDINNTLSGVKKLVSKDKMPLLNTISYGLSDALEFEFDRVKNNVIFKNLLSSRAAMTLLDPIRTGVELVSTFISYPIRAKDFSGYYSLFNEQGIMKKLLEFTDSTMLLRENISKAIDINDGRIKPQSKLTKATNYLSGLPERTMMVTSWMPSFKAEFKNVTDVEFDIAKFNNNESYREKYSKAIMEAAAVADAQTEKIIGTTTKAGQRREVRIAPKFLANIFGAKGTVSKNTATGQILGFFSNYPFRETTEFINGFKEAAEVLKDEGALSSLSQLQKPFGIALNIASYGFFSTASYALSLVLLGGDDDKERGEKILDSLMTFDGFLDELASNAISLAGSKYAAGGKAMLQIAATIGIMSTDDEENKNKIKKLLKDSVFVNPLPVEQAAKFGGKDKVLGAIAMYIPQFVIAADRFTDVIGSKEDIKAIYDKVEKDGIKTLTEDEESKILALNTLFNATQLMLNLRGTSIPAYNKLKVYMNGIKEEEGGDGITKEELKKLDPEMYQIMYGND